MIHRARKSRNQFYLVYEKKKRFEKEKIREAMIPRL